MLTWYIFCRPSVFRLFYVWSEFLAKSTFVVVVQLLSHVHLLWPPWTAAWCQAPLSFIISQSLLKFMSIESVMLSNHLILCHPLLLPSIFPSIRVFFDESALSIRWPKYWSCSLNISPSDEYSGLISISIDWFCLFAVQGILKNLLQHDNLKASIFWCLALFFMVYLSSLWSVFYILTWLLEKP